jgi:ferredoxin-type protein NapF
LDRRELFTSLGASLKRGASSKEVTYLRPPYFKDETLFLKECVNCETKCDTVCEEEIIKIAKDGTPYISFTNGGCTYCDECANFCEHDVLQLEDKEYLNVLVEINKNKCLSWNHTMCFSCKDPCFDNAIDFKAMFMPEINDNCTSCGFCINRCPVDAIDITIIKEKYKDE